MMKKITSLIMVLLMLVSIPAFVYADEHETNTSNENSTDEVESEVEVETEVVSETDAKYLKDSIGSRVRVKQLELRLDERIEVSQAVLSEIEENYNVSSNLTDELQSIIEGFEALRLEINENNFEGEANELAQHYVDLKSEVITLSKDFRKIIHENFSEEERESLKVIAEEASAIYRESLDHKALKEEIKLKVKEQNTQRLKVKFEQFGFQNQEELIAQFQEGNLNVTDLRLRINQEVRALEPEERSLIAQRIQQRVRLENAQEDELKTELRARVEIRKNNIDERIEAKIRERKELIDGRLQERKIEIKEKLDERRIRIDERIGERRSEFRERIKDGEFRSEIRERFIDENGNEVRVRQRVKINKDGEVEIEEEREVETRDEDDKEDEEESDDDKEDSDEDEE